VIYITQYKEQMLQIGGKFVYKPKVMNKLFTLTCFYAGIWGVLGFLVTIVLGAVFCCAGWSPTLFIPLLVLFALIGLAMIWRSVYKCCHRLNQTSEGDLVK